MRTGGQVKRAFVILTALVALAGLAAPGAGAVPHHAKSKGGKIIVFPKRGEVVSANVARLSIRTGRGFRIRLNGKWIPAREFGRARRGVRTMQASISHGLRSGRNTLTVKLRRHGHRRRATVRFRMNPPGPLIGAGRDQVAAIGEDVQLAGRIGPGATPAKESIAWTPIRLPEDTEPSCDPPGTKTQLRSPDGLTANFTPRLPGEYVYRVTDRGNPDEPADIVPVTVLYKNRMVPIETIASAGGDAAKRGIRVGRLTYLLSKAEVAPGAANSGLQVLVLNRETLACISNTRYQNVAELQTAMKKAGSSELVIVAMQPGGASGGIDGKALYEALGAIGFPAEDDKTLPTSGGSFSGIGVGEFQRGDADVNILPSGSNEVAGMTGVLSVDQYNGFAYIPTVGEPLDWWMNDYQGPCKSQEECDGVVGYYLEAQNPRTGAFVSKELIPTGQPGVEPQTLKRSAEYLAEKIEAIPAGDVVQLVGFSNRLTSENSFPPPLGTDDQATYQRLLKAVVSIGGTKNGFNKTATTRGALDSKGQTYVLVGWKGAKEGEGAEGAANVFGQGAEARLIGELRPNRRSLLRPAQESEADTKRSLADVVMSKPSEKWPLEDDPGEMRALEYLGVKAELGTRPRLEYWEKILTPDAWKTRSENVKKMTYAEVPAAERRKFTEAEFKATVTEFSNELKWVAETKEFLAHLSEPFAAKVFDGWATAEEIAKKIYVATNATNAETTLRWVEFTSIMLKLAGPLTGHVSNEIGELMDLGVWGFGASESGRPTYTEVSIQATELAGELRKELENAAATYKAMARVIVSDPNKLKKVGEEVACNSNGGTNCDPEFLFKEKQQLRAGADISRSIRRLAYEKLVPTFYATFKLNRDLYPEQAEGKPREIGTYLCGGVAYPWTKRYGKLQQELASANLLEELDLEDRGRRNWWQTLVLSEVPGESTYYGTPPDEKILEDMFKKVPENSDPTAKGVGMSPEQFLAEQPTSLWDKNSGTRPPEDACVWN